MTRDDLIDDFIRYATDLFSYDDPDRNEKILRSAECYADEMLNPESELCEYSNELIENDLPF